MTQTSARTLIIGWTGLCPFVWFLPGIASAQALGTVPRIEPADCVTRELVDANADCYLFFGQEDRDDPNGTIVELPVAMLAPDSHDGSANADPNPDAVFFFPGGPGLSPMGNFDWIRSDAGNRPVVLIDHRGFRYAKPTLVCPGRTISPYQNELSPVVVSFTDTMERLNLHAETVERCYEKLVAEGIDVAKYNEYDIARDVDEIRQLMGYGKVNVYGYSTGGAIDEFYTIKQMYTDILGRCVAEDPHCRELLPAWYYEIGRARRALDARPYVTTVQADDGRTVTLTFDGVAFIAKIYRRFSDIYMKLPNVLSRVQRHDYSALDDFFRPDRWRQVSADDIDDRQPYGYYLAHVCGDMGGNRPTKEDVVAMLAREPALVAFEDNKICAWWGVDGAVPPEHNDRLHSDVPGLSLHGQVDSCCTTRWGNYLARTMANLQVLEFQGLGHGLPGECRPRVISSFLEDPAAEVDDSCTDDVPLGPWVYQ
jgi:pimeloyl-ACP methyl ester carboxylesterase